MSERIWAELEDKGYVVVPGFLDDEGRRVLLDDFAKGPPPSSYPHGFKLIGRGALDASWPRLSSALEDIRAQTSLEVDLLTFLTFSHYIVTELTERTSFWHQDFDFDYKLTGDHINYLNFWIPIEKPDPARSNVRVIPFDALRARSADAFEKLHGSGGHRFVPKDGRTNVYGNYGKILAAGEQPETEYVLDFDMDELAVTPDLAAGDLLLMRGDIIHKTQDASTKRTAASIRATYSKKIIRKDRVDATAPAAGKRDPVAQLNASILACFDKLGAGEITIGQFVEFASGARTER